MIFSAASAFMISSVDGVLAILGMFMAEVRDYFNISTTFISFLASISLGSTGFVGKKNTLYSLVSISRVSAYSLVFQVSAC